MFKKPHLAIISGLIIVNIILLVVLIVKTTSSLGNGNEAVATIGKKKITRHQLVEQLEKEYGDDILKQLVDQEVIIQLADKYGIEISDDYLNKEFTMLKAIYHMNDNGGLDEEWEEQLKLSMMLEELLTMDVTVSDEELQKYYINNENKFTIKQSANISHIVLKTKEEANLALKQLEEGANFETLAMELSIDQFTANEGGKLGFVTEDDNRFSDEYLKILNDLHIGDVSEPVEIDDGFAIIKLHDRIEGEKYSLDDVKDHIRRKIALDQMDIPVTTKPFWDELKVDLPYRSKTK